MSVFLVTWNLNKEKQNYNRARDQFIAKIDQFPNIADPGLETVRFVSSSASASEVSEHLRGALDENDKLVVTKMNKGQYAGWLNKVVWDWIDARS